MAALLADKPARALQHRPEVVTQHAIWASNSFVSHFGLSALSPPGINLAIRSGRRASYRARVPQREPFRANALAVPRPIYPQTPIGGISRTPRRRHRTAGSPSPENLQAHSLASGLSLLLLPSCTQLLRARRLHWGLGCSVSQRNPFASLRGVPEVYRSLATMMIKVQITPTRTNAVKPIRIHCSGVRCFQIISGLAPSQPHDAGPVYRCADVSAFRNRTEGERGP